MNPKVLILEDDGQQRRDLQDILQREIGLRVEVKSSELEFRRAFDSIASDPPELAVLDVMVKWTSPSREVQTVPEDAKQPENAGLRCARMLREDPRTENVKVILYSVLPKEDFVDASIPQGVISLVKETDFVNLLEKIRELTQNTITV